jgi:monofunctional biosynthetic peptidoglycan transglycosylase
MRKFFPLSALILSGWSAATVIAIMLAVHLFASVPRQEVIKGCFLTKMHGVKLCPQSNDYVSIKNISAHLRNAVIVSEDGNFFSHNGFDLEEIKLSFRENLQKKTFKRGGSTITQQLAKNMFLSAEKTLIRKIKEALITYEIEKTLTKSEILERYLNIVEFGENLYGVKAASQYYFKKSPSQLTVLEASFLALLLPSPKKNSASFRKRQLTPYSRQRIRQTVERLFLLDRISFEDYTLAKLNLNAFPWDGALVTAVPTRPVDDEADLNQPILENEEVEEGFDESDYADDYL